MQDIFMALIHDLTWPAALVMLAVIVGPIVAFVHYVSIKPNKMSHVETMARIEADHRTAMRRLEVEAPKVIEHRRSSQIGD